MSPTQQSYKNQFVIATENHDLTRRLGGFNKCKIVDDGNKTKQTEIIDEPMKEIEDKSHVLRAGSLKGMVDDVVCVKFLNPTLEQKKLQNCNNGMCGKH